MTARPLPDIDKVMINLKTEEFVLDMNTLQALQQLLQWVGDFVLYLLASLPNQVCCPHPPPLPRGGPSPLLTAPPLGPAPRSRPHDALQQHPARPPELRGSEFCAPTLPGAFCVWVRPTPAPPTPGHEGS